MWHDMRTLSYTRLEAQGGGDQFEALLEASLTSTLATLFGVRLSLAERAYVGPAPPLTGGGGDLAKLTRRIADALGHQLDELTRQGEGLMALTVLGRQQIPPRTGWSDRHLACTGFWRPEAVLGVTVAGTDVGAALMRRYRAALASATSLHLYGAKGENTA
jgi:hypothetical protein